LYETCLTACNVCFFLKKRPSLPSCTWKCTLRSSTSNNKLLIMLFLLISFPVHQQSRHASDYCRMPLIAVYCYTVHWQTGNVVGTGSRLADVIGLADFPEWWSTALLPYPSAVRH